MTFPSFTSGEILRATDMNAVGLWLVKSQTVGTGVSSVTVTGAFSADYDNYRIVYSGGVSSALCLMQIYMGASPAANGYYGSRSSTTVGGVFNGTGNINTGDWSFANAVNTNHSVTSFDLYQPFLSARTSIFSQYVETNAGSSTFGIYGGYLDNSTSYTSFTLDPQGANTITGGTIRVYGYRN